MKHPIALWTLAALGLAAVPAHAQLQPGKSARILALGDSLTRGSVDGFGNYRRPLQSLLAGGGYSYQFVGANTEQSFNYAGSDPGQTFTPYQPGHEGYGSFRIDQISGDGPATDDGGVTYPGLGRVFAADAPDVVLLMLGTNDADLAYDPGGPGYGGATGFAADAAMRLNTLVGRVFTDDPGASLVLANITPFADAAAEARGQAFNAFVPQIAARYNANGNRVVFADMHAALQNTALYISGDGVHPTTAGYDRMAQVWYAALTPRLVPAPAVPESSSPVLSSLGILALAIRAGVSRRKQQDV